MSNNNLLMCDIETGKRDDVLEKINLFKVYPSLTAKEFSELPGTLRADGEILLNELTEQGNLLKFTTKNGSIWRKK